MEIDEQKARVVQAVVGLGLFPTSTIYKEFYDMTDQEIEQVKEELQEEQDELAAKESAQEMEDMVTQAGLDQQGKDQDMGRDQMGADADAARDQGSAQADHERQMELEKQKVRKEAIDPKIVGTLEKLKKRILNESGDSEAKVASIDRILSRHGVPITRIVKNPQNNGLST